MAGKQREEHGDGSGIIEAEDAVSSVSFCVVRSAARWCGRSRKRVPGGTARLFLANRLFFPSIARKKVDFVMNPSKKGYSS